MVENGGPPDNWRRRLRDPLLTVLTVLVVILLFVIAPLRAAGVVAAGPFAGAFIVMLAVALFIVSDSMIAVASIVAAIVLAVSATLLRLHEQSATELWLHAAAWLIAGLTLSVVVAPAVYAPGQVTYHRIVGAMLLYLNIGVIFVALYFFLILSEPRVFNGIPVLKHDLVVIADLIYFSFVTLTSVGYGDIVPVHPLARGLANVESLIGQLFPATFLARLFTLRIEHKPEP